MGNNSFAPYSSTSISFIVKNISPQKKVIKIFNYPILYNGIRDLMKIPGVAEGDIRASLLKGEIRHKILAKDIIITQSDINLLQFNLDNKLFLQNAGVDFGYQIDINQIKQGTILSSGIFVTQTTIDVGAIPIYSTDIIITDSNVISSSKVLVWSANVEDLDAIIYSATPQDGSFILNITALPGPIVGLININYIII